MVDIPRAMAVSAGYGSWFTLIIASIVFGFIAVICVSLNYKFKGDMISDYSKKVFGKFGAVMITLYYFLYFCMIVILLNIRVSTILYSEFLPKTPKAATLLLGIPLFCYIAYKGIVTIARLMEYIGLVYLLVGVSVLIIMITQGKATNIRPMFNPSDIKLYLVSLKECIFPFLGIECLLIFPLSSQNGKSIKITAFTAIIGIGLFYILVVESCIMKLGINDIAHYNSSLIVAIRDMELTFLHFFKRFDVLFLTIGFAGFFLAISVVYTAMLELLSKLLPKAKRKVLVICIGSISYIVVLLLDKVKGFSKFMETGGLILGLVAVFLLPLTILIASKVKKNV